MSFTPNKRSTLVAAALVLITLLLYWPVHRFEFVNYDDDRYITKNPFVTAGLTWRGVGLAFTAVAASNWHPVTWLSHMFDCELYGLRPAGHHLSNWLFHAANVLLLFAVLRKMSGRVWSSALVAALFAWHPLHVESVAWVAERKDLLSTFFGLLALLAYAQHVEQARNQRPGARAAYGLSLTAFALSLMSKPMLVTLPFLLLLLDYWPLNRIAAFNSNSADCPKCDWRRWGRQVGRLATEKWPFFVLSAISSIITYSAQSRSGAVVSEETIPLFARLTNAAVAVARYLGKTLWPEKLAVFYPHPVVWPWPQVAGAALLAAAIAVLVVRAQPRRPYLLTGWFWFLGTLVPVIGIVQVGEQSMADRYTYWPLIGVFLGLVWWLGEALQHRRHAQPVMICLTAAVLAACLITTAGQLRHWQNSIALFEHALTVTHRSYPAHLNLACALADAGRPAEAERHFREALKLNPTLPQLLYSYGNNCARLGKPRQAAAYYRAALRQFPNNPHAHFNLACTLAGLGEPAAALPHYAAAVQLNPQDGDYHYNYSVALGQQGRMDEAFAHAVAAVQRKPNAAEAHGQLGWLLLRQGKLDEAISSYQTALSLQPAYLDALINLGSALEQRGEPRQAAEQYAEALRISPDCAHAHSNLGVLLAKQGKPAEALGHFEKVVALEPQNANAHYNLGNALFDLGQDAAAAVHYAEVLTLNPADEAARRKLALCRARQAGAAPTGGVP